jgi:excisionase family DNA binding protein
MATIGFNNKISTEEAQKILGCAYSTVVALIKSKKLRGQKIGKTWWLDADEVYKARDSKLVTPRNSSPKSEKGVGTHAGISVGADEIAVQFPYSKEKFELIKRAFNMRGNDMNIVKFLQGKLDEAHDKIKAQLENINLD